MRRFPFALAILAITAVVLSLMTSSNPFKGIAKHGEEPGKLIPSQTVADCQALSSRLDKKFNPKSLAEQLEWFTYPQMDTDMFELQACIGTDPSRHEEYWQRYLKMNLMAVGRMWDCIDRTGQRQIFLDWEQRLGEKSSA